MASCRAIQAEGACMSSVFDPSMLAWVTCSLTVIITCQAWPSCVKPFSLAGGEAQVDINKPGAAVRETQMVAQPLAQLRQRVALLLDEFPDNPLLTQLRQLATRIQGASSLRQWLGSASPSGMPVASVGSRHAAGVPFVGTFGSV